MSYFEKTIYTAKYVWYSLLAVFLKGSRSYWSEKKTKYSFLKRGMEPPKQKLDSVKFTPSQVVQNLGKCHYEPFNKTVLKLDTIKKLIDNPDVKIVSFDIFDTLLFRPGFYPTDLFYLLANKVNSVYQIDFISLRLHAEEQLDNPYASLTDIYRFIEEQFHLPHHTICQLYEEELACEKQLLTLRRDIFSLYQHALSLHKRVIAVSDMYLPSSFLNEVLHAAGYTQLAKIYVSNECRARKDDGSLFNYVLKQENISSHEMLHIGDNYQSDFEIPFKQHIAAVYYPSIKDIIFQENSIYADILQRHLHLSQDPLTRILLCFALFEEFQDTTTAPKGPQMWDNIQQFTKMILGPVVFYVAHYIATNQTIQSQYDRVHFAARDGFLPKIAYDILTKHIHAIPSNYLYASRRAYFPLFYSSLEQFIRESMYFDMLDSLTFEGLLTQIITDQHTLQIIKQKLPAHVLQSFVKHNLENCLASLSLVQNEIQHYLSLMRTRATAYYRKQLISTTGREIVFDLGYSGSISNALTRISDMPVDKIYFWQTATNTQRDEQNGTKTFCLFSNNSQRQRIQLLYEELFSPLVGSSIGFDQNLNPVLEQISFSPAMKQTFHIIQGSTEKFIKSLCKRFGNLLPYLSIKDPEALHTVLLHMLEHSPYAETSLFKDVIFPDPLACDIDMTLESKLSIRRPGSVFDGTGFNNPQNYVHFPASTQPFHGKIAIHIHVFYMDVLQELLVYLEKFPVAFDLYITFPQTISQHNIRAVLNKQTLPGLRSIQLFTVENRGRDVAPWLITLKPFQEKYDLFCHLHTKKSKHIGPWCNRWRQYMYDNLLSAQKILPILSCFHQDNQLGVLFPKIFPELVKVCVSNDIPQEGNFGEITLINRLAGRMGIKRTYCYNLLFFSEGNMFWYRPQALKSLFDLNLQFSDFPVEPIGVGGTVAHAIERLPAFVCQATGYQAKAYDPQSF